MSINVYHFRHHHFYYGLTLTSQLTLFVCTDHDLFTHLFSVVFPFLVSSQSMARDHLNKTSRLALRRVQALVVIELYFIVLCQGKELEM